MKDVYITGLGVYMPNEPVSNDEMESYLGKVFGKSSFIRERILKQNGIKTRYYAMDRQQESTHSNAQLAVNAVG